jgi:hypothetical protein
VDQITVNAHSYPHEWRRAVIAKNKSPETKSQYVATEFKKGVSRPEATMKEPAKRRNIQEWPQRGHSAQTDEAL